MNGYSFLDTQQALLPAPITPPFRFLPASQTRTWDRPDDLSGAHLRILPEPGPKPFARVYLHPHEVLRPIDASEWIAFGALAGAGVAAIVCSFL